MANLLDIAETCTCPEKPAHPGWREFGNHCYFSSTLHGSDQGSNPLISVQNFDNSIKVCEARGGDLVSINTEGEKDFIHGNL